MSRIYKTTDRIDYRIGEIVVTVSPLSLADKTELHDLMLKAEKGEAVSLVKASALALKMAVKDIKGLTDSDGNEYQLEFGEDKKLSEDTVDALMNLQESSQMIGLCSLLIGGVPQKLPEGVTLEMGKSEKKKRARIKALD